MSPASGAGIGLTCAQVTGTIYSVDAAGPLPCRVINPGLLTAAKFDAFTTAFGDAAGRSGGLPVAANDLAGKTLTHGVYKSAAAMGLLGGGTLTLDGGNDPTSVFIFQLGTLLTVSNGSRVDLINQAQSCNIFWQVDSATIGTTATFSGTILAATAITVANGSTIDGRLLAGTGNVTLINDTITAPTCLIAPEARERPTPTPASATATPTSATATPASATATPVSATATPPSAATATPGPVAIVAPTASPGTPVTTLPNTSALDRSGPPVLAGLLLALIGALILRSRRSAPTVR